MAKRSKNGSAAIVRSPAPYHVARIIHAAGEFVQDARNSTMANHPAGRDQSAFDKLFRLEIALRPIRPPFIAVGWQALKQLVENLRWIRTATDKIIEQNDLQAIIGRENVGLLVGGSSDVAGTIVRPIGWRLALPRELIGELEIAATRLREASALEAVAGDISKEKPKGGQPKKQDDRDFCALLSENEKLPVRKRKSMRKIFDEFKGNGMRTDRERKKEFDRMKQQAMRYPHLWRNR